MDYNLYMVGRFVDGKLAFSKSGFLFSESLYDARKMDYREALWTAQAHNRLARSFGGDNMYVVFRLVWNGKLTYQIA